MPSITLRTLYCYFTDVELCQVNFLVCIVMMFWFFFFIFLMWWIDCFLSVQMTLHSWDKPHLIVWQYSSNTRFHLLIFFFLVRITGLYFFLVMFVSACKVRVLWPYKISWELFFHSIFSVILIVFILNIFDRIYK